MVISSCLGLVRAAPLADPEVDAYNHRMSTINIGPDYKFTTENVLLEGARVVVAMGANSYKFSMNPKPGYGITLPSSMTSLKQVARDEPSYRATLDLPGIKHHVFWCYSFANPDNWKWRNGLSATRASAEYHEIRDLVSYLLTQYSGTGKSFYLGHWEGDWSMGVPEGGKGNPSPLAVQGMIDWLNIRQQAVDDAKVATQHENVNVYHYTEVNRVVDAHVNPPSSNQRVINAVVPNVPNLDFISWSSYDIQSRSPEEIRFYLDFAESFLPPAKSAVIPGKRIFIGEFGWGNIPEPEQAPRIAAFNRTLFEWGCPFSFYWELYAQIPGIEYFDLIDANGNKTANYWVHQRYANAAKLALLRFKQRNGKLPTATEFSGMASTLMSAALVEPVPLFLENLQAEVTGRNTVTLEGRMGQGIYNAEQARVFLCWGKADGGTDRQTWQHVVDLGVNTRAGESVVSASLEGLTPGVNHYWRFFATTPSSTVWAEQTSTFVTHDVHTFTPTSAGSHSWADAANWNASGIPSGGPTTGVAIFEDVTTPLAGGSHVIQDAPEALTLSKFTLNGRGPAGSSAAAVEVGTAGNVWTFAGGAPQVRLRGEDHNRALTVSVLPDLVLANNANICGDGSARFQFPGAISGTATLVKTGSSALVLSGNNSFMGGLDIREGMVTCNSAASFGNGSIILGDTSGNASATLCGFSSSTTAANPITVRSGSTGTVTIRNPSFGSLNFLGDLSVNRTVTLDGGTSSGAFNIFKTGSLAGSGNIVVSSASANATVILQHSNSTAYTGSVLVQKGTLRLASSSALNVANTVSLDTSGILDIRSGVTLAGLQGAAGSLVLCNDSSTHRTLTLGGSGNYYHAGVVSDSITSDRKLAIAKTGNGTQVLAGTNTFSGGLIVSGGTLQANSIGALGNGKVSVSGSARKLQHGISGNFSNALELTGGSGISGQGLLDTDSNIHAVLSGPVLITASPSVSGAGHFGASSTGLLTVNGFIDSAVSVDWRRNTGIFAGGGNYKNFRIRSGTVRLGRTDGLATSATVEIGSNGDASLDLAGFNQTLVGITKGANAALVTNSSMLTDSELRLSGSCNFAGAISDGPAKRTAVTIDGGLVILGGSNTHSGPTQLLSGTLAFGAGASFSGASEIRITASASLDTTALPTFAPTAMQPVNFVLGQDGTCGRIVSEGLDIRSLRATFAHSTIPDTPVYRLATYQGLVGEAFAVVIPPDGYRIDYQYAGGTSIALVATRLHLWRQTYFPGSSSESGPGANLACPLGDGVPNLIKFALGTNPLLAAGQRVSLTEFDGSLHFTYTPSTAALADGIIFDVEYSDDLTEGGWRTSSVGHNAPGEGGLPVTVVVPKGLGDRRFVRLKVALPAL